MADAMPLQHAPGKLGRLVVVGLGLIGGSFAKGMREKGLFDEVVGVDLDAESRRLAVELGVVDRCETELAAACQGAAVIQLAVPILAMEKLLGQLATLDLGDAVLTDVGSAKAMWCARRAWPSTVRWHALYPVIRSPAPSRAGWRPPMPSCSVGTR